jgi:hypothetical protein
MESVLAQIPDPPLLLDSITHVVCAPRVCGIQGNRSYVRINELAPKSAKMVDGGSNVCVTGDLGLLLDVMDIDPFAVSVALEGAPSSYDDCITKQGLLLLTLADGTTYYQTCFYFTNMVKAIISPSAILASSDTFVQWNQEGFKDPTIPGHLCFSSHDGILSMFFNLDCRNGLYYCTTNAYIVDHDPVHIRCHCTVVSTNGHSGVIPTQHPSKFVPTSKARQAESEVWALRFGYPGD